MAALLNSMEVRGFSNAGVASIENGNYLRVTPAHDEHEGLRRISLSDLAAVTIIARSQIRGIAMAQMPKLKSGSAFGKARVLIVDDQPVVRERVSELINSERDLALCGSTDDPRLALEVIRTAKPALIITGLALKGAHGLELIKDVHVRYPNVAVLVFSMYDEALYAERAIRAGARGFITKREPTVTLLRAIRCVLGGEIYVSEKIAAHSLRQFFGSRQRSTPSELAQLSDRELEVFDLIGRGRSSREIAANLHLNLKTIETYRSRIKTKLDLRSPTELAQRAQQWSQRAPSRRERRARRA